MKLSSVFLEKMSFRWWGDYAHKSVVVVKKGLVGCLGLVCSSVDLLLFAVRLRGRKILFVSGVLGLTYKSPISMSSHGFLVVYESVQVCRIESLSLLVNDLLEYKLSLLVWCRIRFFLSGMSWYLEIVCHRRSHWISFL